MTTKKRISVSTSSANETTKWGQKLGRLLKRGDTVLLFATLGGGKTTFTQGLLKGLGGHDLPPSPTFIMAQTFKARVPLHHMDFYRMNAAELIAKGVQDYFTGEGEIAPGVVVVEWPERCRDIWPKERLDVKISLRKNLTDRKLEFIARGKRFESLLEKFVIPEILNPGSSSRKNSIARRGFRE